MRLNSIFNAVAALLIVAAAACSTSGKITSVTSADFDSRIHNKRVQLVDVRTPKEFAAGHIAGARNIDVKAPDFITQASGELKKGKPVYVYCKGGVRSKAAASLLVEKGYNVINLDKGIDGWKADGMPVTEESSK